MLEQLLQSFQPYLDKYGYFALFAAVFVEGIGLPAPGQTMIVAGALFAINGKMNLVLVMLLSWSAAVLGNNLGFALGRFGGRQLLLRFGGRFGLGIVELERLESFFDRYGGAIIIIARFVEGLRQFNGIVAGSSGMTWGRFLIYNVAGAALWVGVWSGMVYLFGADVEAFIDQFRRVELLLMVFGVGTVLWLLVRFVRGTRTGVRRRK